MNNIATKIVFKTALISAIAAALSYKAMRVAQTIHSKPYKKEIARLTDAHTKRCDSIMHVYYKQINMHLAENEILMDLAREVPDASVEEIMDAYRQGAQNIDSLFDALDSTLAQAQKKHDAAINVYQAKIDSIYGRHANIR